MALDETAVIAAYDFDMTGDGGGRVAAHPLTADRLARPPAEGAWRWVHLDRMVPSTRDWLYGESGLPAVAAEALLDEETRPRISPSETGTIVILRGVNLNAGAEPEDMVSVRLWVEPGRVVSLRRYKIFAVQAIRDEIATGAVPAAPGAFLARLAAGLTDRVAETVEAAEDRVDAAEEEALEGGRPEAVRRSVAAVRRQVVAFRRFLSPQRDLVARLEALEVPWLEGADRRLLHETAEELTRIVELLDALRDRAAILQETLASEATEQINRNMYLLSIVAALFLPLGFLTGLLGINVGGLPGAEASWAFAAVCAALAAVVAGQVWLFRRLRWL